MAKEEWRNMWLPILYTAMVVGLFFASRLIPQSDILAGDASVTDRAKATLDILLEMTKLALSLNSAMFAGAGLLAGPRHGGCIPRAKRYRESRPGKLSLMIAHQHGAATLLLRLREAQ